MQNERPRSFIRRIGGYLHRVVPVVDGAGKVVSYTLKPWMVEFRLRDLMQVIVGACILAVPVAFTEETWNLGKELPLHHALGMSVLSLIFIALFVYFNFYRFTLRGYVFQYIKRVIAVYLVSLLVVGMILTLIQKCPWGEQNLWAIKRILIVAFPASMSAAVSDSLK